MQMEARENTGVQRTYSANEIAGILGVSVRKVYEICENTGDFKVIRIGKRCLRIHKESFDAVTIKMRLSMTTSQGARVSHAQAVE